VIRAREVHSYSLCPKDIVELLLNHVQTLACAVVERQWTSNDVREKALLSHLLLAHVGKFVIVSAAAFLDLDKALLQRQEHILQLVVAHCIKGIHDGFNRLIDVVWCLLVLKRLNCLEESDIEKKN
jgi:hypothetical protein